MLAPFLYLAATLANQPLIVVAIGIVIGAFGQVTVNDAMVGKYTTDELRSRAYAVRYFICFTAAARLRRADRLALPAGRLWDHAARLCGGLRAVAHPAARDQDAGAGKIG
jgi:hypothetical protein